MAACLVELQEEIAKQRQEVEKAAERKRRALVDTFQSTLRGLMGAMLTPATAWAEAEKLIEGKAFAQALDEAGRKAAFEELVASLKPDDEEEKADEASKKRYPNPNPNPTPKPKPKPNPSPYPHP